MQKHQPLLTKLYLWRKPIIDKIISMAQTKSTVTVYMISLPNVRNMLGSNVHVFTIRSPHPLQCLTGNLDRCSHGDCICR